MNASFRLKQMKVSRSASLLILLVTGGSCRDKAVAVDSSDSIYAKCSAGYPLDGCESFDIERNFIILATVDCNSAYRCGGHDPDSVTKENIDACISDIVRAYKDGRALGYCPSTEYDECAVSECTRGWDCEVLADLERALDGEMTIADWCEEARYSPDSCDGEKSQIRCEPPMSG